MSEARFKPMKHEIINKDVTRDCVCGTSYSDYFKQNKITWRKEYDEAYVRMESVVKVSWEVPGIRASMTIKGKKCAG